MKKKIVFLFFIMFMFNLNVFAQDNKLFLFEKDNKIYYDESLYNKDLFMTHIDMVPGGSYTDELIIENGAAFDLSLYLKVIEDEQSFDANELLDSIDMKIYLNDIVIYDGKVKGLDYKLNGVNLQDSVFLEKMSAGKKSKIKVELFLSKDYDNKSYNDYSYLKWKFIAQFSKTKVESANVEDVVVDVVPAPITGINKNYVPIIIASIGLCTLGVIIIVFAKKKKSDDK